MEEGDQNWQGTHNDYQKPFLWRVHSSLLSYIILEQQTIDLQYIASRRIYISAT